MSTPTDFKSFVNLAMDLARVVLPVIAGFALLAFLWGLAKFIFKVSTDAKSINDGKKLIEWGLIALFILTAFWSILEFFYNDIGFTRPFGPPLLPTN